MAAVKKLALFFAAALWGLAGVGWASETVSLRLDLDPEARNFMERHGGTYSVLWEFYKGY